MPRFRKPYAGVVEQDHFAVLGETVDHRRIPMVHGAGKVLVEDERVPRENRPLTGRGANLRARTRSVSGFTAVDVEDMAGDE